jgi:hypothetical protein
MANLIGMVACALATIALWVVIKKNWASQHPIALRAALAAAYSSTLLLALRFGGRTYPGVWMGKSGLLNVIFNGSDMFWFAYYCVVLGALSDGAAVLLQRGSTPAMLIGARIASTVRILSLGVAVVVALYGFTFAIILLRLPH